MEALPKALDPLFDSNTIPDFSDVFGICGPKKSFLNQGNVGFAVGGSRVLRNRGIGHQENMCTDLLGPFLRPQEASGGPRSSKI